MPAAGSAAGDPRTQPPESGRSGWQIFLSSVGLLVLAGIGMFLASRQEPSVDWEAVLGDEIEVGELPFGFQALSIQRLQDGRNVALLGDPQDGPPLEESLQKKSKGGKGGKGGRGRFGGGGASAKFNPDSSWIRLPAGELGHAPWQLSLVRYPESSAESVLKKQFGRIPFEDLSQISEKGGETAMDTGHLVWAGYRLPWVRTRFFRKVDGEATFHDSMRVNLTRGRHALVLYARWRVGQQGDPAQLQEALHFLRLRPGGASVGSEPKAK